MTSDRGRPAALGILLLENAPLTLPGAMGAPDTFAYPTIHRTVPGAWVDNVVRGDPAALEAYVEAGRELERAGAAAITTNCGFTVLYQAALSARLPVPVATSSLLLLPLMARLLPRGRSIGVLTYDARRLSRAHLDAAGVPDGTVPLAVGGIEGTGTWAELARPAPRVGPETLAADVLGAARALLGARPEVSSLLFECAAFCPVSPRARAELRVPVFDFVTLADILAASATGARSTGRAAPA
jgi:hypothetical protein